MKKYFKISEIAYLTNTTRKTLIFYDNFDIIKPDFVAENGYRYYSMAQISQIEMIRVLSDFGMSLKEIKNYVDTRTYDEFYDLLTKIKTSLNNKKKIINMQLEIVEKKQQSLKEVLNWNNNYDFIKLEMRKAFDVITSEKLKNVNQTRYIKEISEFKEILSLENISSFGFDTIVEKEYLNNNYLNQISYFCMPVQRRNKKLRIKTIEAGLYLITFHQGPYNTSYKTYKRLFEYIEIHNLEIDGDSYEKALVNSFSDNDEKNYILEIAIKVKLKD